MIATETRIGSALAVLLLFACDGCLPKPSSDPGMVGRSSLDELAQVDPPAGHRTLLVVYPRNACSGSARIVFTDGAGTFYGAVAPGEAASLTVPEATRTMHAISSVEVNAPVGMWHTVDDVQIAPAPSGLLLEARRFSARHCGGGNGQYADVKIASISELEAALADPDAELRFLTPKREAGQRWLDAHRKRMDELLARSASASSPAIVTRTHIP